MFLNFTIRDKQNARGTPGSPKGKRGGQGFFHFRSAHVSIKVFQMVPCLGNKAGGCWHHAWKEVLAVTAEECDVKAICRN